jgi:hypothetical protein
MKRIKIPDVVLLAVWKRWLERHKDPPTPTDIFEALRRNAAALKTSHAKFLADTENSGRAFDAARIPDVATVARKMARFALEWEARTAVYNVDGIEVKGEEFMRRLNLSVAEFARVAEHFEKLKPGDRLEYVQDKTAATAEAIADSLERSQLPLEEFVDSLRSVTTFVEAHVDACSDEDQKEALVKIVSRLRSYIRLLEGLLQGHRTRRAFRDAAERSYVSIAERYGADAAHLASTDLLGSAMRALTSIRKVVREKPNGFDSRVVEDLRHDCDVVIGMCRGHAPVIEPQDEWERRLVGLAKDCEVSLPDSALSNEGLYE